MDLWGVAISNLMAAFPAARESANGNAGVMAMKSLGEENRRVVEMAMRGKKSATTHQLHLATGLSRETCHKHLKSMERVGLVKVSKFTWEWIF